MRFVRHARFRGLIAAAIILAALICPRAATAAEKVFQLTSRWTSDIITRLDSKLFVDMRSGNVLHQIDKDTLVDMKSKTYYRRTGSDTFVDQRTGEPFDVN